MGRKKDKMTTLMLIVQGYGVCMGCYAWLVLVPWVCLDYFFEWSKNPTCEHIYKKRDSFHKYLLIGFGVIMWIEFFMGMADGAANK